MITNINKKVICIKDIPSNIIEEAIFILKTDSNSCNEKIEKRRKEIIENEAENFLRDYMDDIPEYEATEEKESFKSKRIKAILISIGAVVLCYLISLLFR